MIAIRLAAVALCCAAMSIPVFAVFAAPAPVPEPTAMALFGAGALLLGGLRYVNKRRQRK